jgi:hypothetical protein
MDLCESNASIASDAEYKKEWNNSEGEKAVYTTGKLGATILVALHLQAFYKATLALVPMVKWWQLAVLRRVEERWLNNFTEGSKETLPAICRDEEKKK